MAYNTDHLKTAGKVTILTTFLGVVAFAVIFLLNIGQSELRHVEAQSTATTTITILNTPPYWAQEAREEIGSTTTNPTNAGDVIVWQAIGGDANGEPYYLLICANNATPTANTGAAPECDSGPNQWAVSTSTTAGQVARAGTTTQAAWAESNDWYAWVCDDNAVSPRCVATTTQGTPSTATSSSPFEVNHRPAFSLFSDDSPKDPGEVVTFYSTSSDSDTSGTADTVRLLVCNDPDFSTSTDTCGPGGSIATSTFVSSDASATYTIVIPTQDQDYTAYGYVIDNHGFESLGAASGTDATLSVNNVAPTITASSIVINGGSDMTLTTEAGETTGFTFEFTSVDNNSCDAVGGGLGDEVTDYVVGIYRSGVGSSSCAVSGDYDPNDCYTSTVATTTWNLACTASTTSCTGNMDTTMESDCTFPLWYIADPTDGTSTSTQYESENWQAVVTGIDDDLASGPASTSASGVEVNSLLAFALNTLEIAYTALEPGQQTDPIVSTTTIAATGNVGMDQRLIGDSMCPTYAPTTTCPNSASSTIPASEQVYATSTVAYAAGTALSSTTNTELELNVPKSTATSSQATGDTFWGIRVPGTISLAGDYSGQNVFTAIVGEQTHW